MLVLILLFKIAEITVALSLTPTNGIHENALDTRLSSTTCADLPCNDNAELHRSPFQPHELLEFEAIQALHRQLDDDMNGNVDITESDEFLREELQYERGNQMRHENFHKNNDDQISVQELWSMWTNSEVHNWTVEATADWLVNVVELPQFEEKFRQLKINGTYLPRLAVNHQNILTAYLGIKDIITRQKLSLKAQDVVLFGSPRNTSSFAKDLTFIILLIGATTVSYFVYCRNVEMSKDLKALKKSEELLRDLQKQLEIAKSDQQLAASSKDEFLNIIQPTDTDEMDKLQNEIKLLRTKLHRAEVELQLKRWVPPPELIYWLQATYDFELKEHKRKQDAAERLLEKASKACDKLKKRRSSFLNAFIPINFRSIDEVDDALLNARTALATVIREHQKRKHRWNQIEMLLNPDIDIHSHLKSVSILSQNSWSHPKSICSNA